MTEVFISYAREDQSEAIKLRNALRAEKPPIEIWWDDEVLASNRFEEKIDISLGKAAAIIVLWSEHSVSSNWVNYEASIGKVRDVLVPIKISDCVVPDPFSGIQTSNLTNWKGYEDDREFARLASVVHSKVKEAEDEEKARSKREKTERENQKIIDKLPKELSKTQVDIKLTRKWIALTAVFGLSGLAYGLYSYIWNTKPKIEEQTKLILALESSISEAPNLSDYALRSDIPTVSEPPDLSLYALKSDIRDFILTIQKNIKEQEIKIGDLDDRVDKREGSGLSQVIFSDICSSNRPGIPISQGSENSMTAKATIEMGNDHGHPVFAIISAHASAFGSNAKSEGRRSLTLKLDVNGENCEIGRSVLENTNITNYYVSTSCITKLENPESNTIQATANVEEIGKNAKVTIRYLLFGSEVSKTIVSCEA